MSSSTPRNCRTIRLPFCQDDYDAIVEHAIDFRAFIDEMVEKFPELFPQAIKNGYLMKDIYFSKKLSIQIRRIDIAEVAYTIHPSFVLPNLTGMVNDVEHALFLRKFNVPYWALCHIYGRDPMYWYRTEQALGRFSIVGTTVRNADKLPEHCAADEKHTRISGNKAYVATTVANECILGASVTSGADEKALKEGYGVFKEEALKCDPNYSPSTVNVDGWKATKNAWIQLFPSILLILCFLHVFIGIRDRAKKKFKTFYQDFAPKLWDCYRAPNKRSFSQRIRRLYEWCKKNKMLPPIFLKKVEKLRKNIDSFKNAYDHPGAHRTSNMLDRLMQRMDIHLFTTQYFHGSLKSANLGIRAWVLIHNFASSNPITVKKYNGLQSPAERLNGFCYHDNWLQNLLVSASLGGSWSAPQNPI